MTIGIIGYTGFVGKNLLRELRFDYLYNSKNINDIKNMEFDRLYVTALPARKWYANKFPQEDTDNMYKLIENLKHVIVKEIILISTIDIYDTINTQVTESYIPNYENNHTYGKNRFLFEEFIKSNFEKYLIVRLPALFGQGLKKNIIYDLINDNQIENIPINSKFQWYNLNWLNDDIRKCLQKGLKICNFFTEPLETSEITNLFNYDKNIYQNKTKIEYNLCTQFSSIFNESLPYIRSKNSVLHDLKIFIEKEKQIIKKNRNYRLAVSNICSNLNNRQLYALLDLYGITHLEIAFTKFYSWDEITSDKMLKEVKLLKEHGLNLYSAQSITYTLNELNIFNKDTHDQLFEHLIKVITIASQLDIKILVFGCPKNRKMLNNSSIDEAVVFFKKLNSICEKFDVIVCLENNSKKYSCNFMNTLEEVINIVKTTNCSHIKAMADIGNVLMEDDDIENIIEHHDLFAHIHVSEPYMNTFEQPHDINSLFSKLLDDIKYHHVVTLEMVNKNNDLEKLNLSLSKFVSIY